MKNFVSLLIVAIVGLFSLNSFAWDPPSSPKPASAILDQASILSPEAHQRLDVQLKRINTNSTNEIAALIIPSLDGQSIEDVGIATAKAWGVGKKDLDNGVLVILAMKEHKSRIEVGKGIEGDLPDLKSNDILQKVLRPYMKKGDVEGGLSATFDSISSAIASHKAAVLAPTSNTQTTTDELSSTSIVLVPVVILGFVFLIWGIVYLSSKRRHKELMKELEMQRLRDIAFRDKVSGKYHPPVYPAYVPQTVAAYVAPKKPTVPRPSPKKTYTPTTYTPSPSSSSSDSSSSWGDSSSGGSFGGGDFGGGGSSGDW